MKLKLRPHQKKQTAHAYRALETMDHVLYQAPTGFGKSIVMKKMIKKLGGRSLVIVPTKVLAYQLEALLDARLVMGRIDRGAEDSQVVVSTKDTAANRDLGDFDYVFWDEVHDGHGQKRFKALQERYWTTAKWIGFSATPMTAKWTRLEGWDTTISHYQTSWLIKKGFLSEYRYQGTSLDAEMLDRSKLKVTGGEYNQGEVAKAATMPASLDVLKKAYDKYDGAAQKTVIFAATIEHAKRIAEVIPGSYYVAATVPDVEDRIEKFKRSSNDTIINVNMLTAGFDAEDMTLLIIAKPIRTKRTAIQIWGRVLRKYGDSVATIVDLCGVVRDVKCLPDDKQRYDIEAAPKRKAGGADPLFCEKCEGIFTNWTYIRDLDEKGRSIMWQVCPVCKHRTLHKKDTPMLPDPTIRDSKEYRKEKKREKKRLREERRLNKEARRRERREERRIGKKLDTFEGISRQEAVNMVKEMISMYRPKMNPNAGYYLVTDILGTKYQDKLVYLLKKIKYMPGLISEFEALNEIEKLRYKAENNV